MADKLTQTGSQASQELSRSLCQEQIMINGADVSGCEYIGFGKDGTKSVYPCQIMSRILPPRGADCRNFPKCQFRQLMKQLARKTQECKQIQEKYESLKLENQEGYEIVDELKQECEKLKVKLIKKNERCAWRSFEGTFCPDAEKYRKALEEIEEFCITYSDNHDAYETVYFWKDEKRMYYFNSEFPKISKEDENIAVIMQCTGIADKNGKLIYEGDVLKIHTVWEHRPYYYAIVKWQRNRYKFQKIGKGVFLGDIAPLKHFANSEVIGNIYENPELLEEQCANQLNRE